MARHPKVGRILLAFRDEPQTTRAWARGAAGEERVARHLEKHLGDQAVLLHDRKIPGSRANLHHIVVGPTGVFVIDTKNYDGRVEHRKVGPMFDRQTRLYVGRRDCTTLVERTKTQALLVAKILGDGLPAIPALCFTHAEWPMLARPFHMSGVWIGWTRALGKIIVSTPVLDRSRINAIAQQLASAFPPYEV